jgi:hypothetical protein
MPPPTSPQALNSIVNKPGLFGTIGTVKQLVQWNLGNFERPLVNELLEIEKIKQLKARYFRALGTNDWTLFGSTLTEDCVARYSGEK